MSALLPEGLSGMTPSQVAALQRLALSRSKLHAALLQPQQLADAAEAADAAGGASVGRLMRRLWRQLRQAGSKSTVVDLALGALQSWWSTAPWRQAVNGARQNLETTVVPLVRRYPWAAVGVAAAAGAMMVSLRPWRWVPMRGSWPLWRAGLVAKLAQQAVHLPWDTILAAVMAGLATAQATRPARAEGAAGDTAEGGASGVASGPADEGADVGLDGRSHRAASPAAASDSQHP
jgi:hypothetical protein